MPPLPVRHLTAFARQVRRTLRRERADLVAFASQLVQVASENPPGSAYRACARLIKSQLGALGFPARVLDPTGEGPCVLATLGERGRALYWSGHYDVVPAQDSSQFAPALRKGNLFGRGSADMKGGIAAMVYAMHALRQGGCELAGRVISVSVPDEETSGPRGTIALAAAGHIERDAVGMLTMEPTSGAVWSANRGVISLRISVRGRPAHVGLHFRGRNAFTGMLDIAAHVAALANEVSGRYTSERIRPEAARRSVLLMGGELSGGHNFNVVPDRVSFTIDRRTNPEEDFAVERERLFEIIRAARDRGIDCTADVLQEGHAATTDRRTPLGRALGASIRAVTGRSPQFELCPGVLETRHYAALGIPAFAYGPGLLSVSHGPHEFVSVASMLSCAEVYALTAMRVLGVRK